MKNSKLVSIFAAVILSTLTLVVGVGSVVTFNATADHSVTVVDALLMDNLAVTNAVVSSK